MLTHRTYMKLLVALALSSVTLSASSVFGQSPATQTAIRQTEVAAEESKPSGPENKVAAGDDVAALKAENAAVRERLCKMEEQQKALLAQFDRFKRRLDGTAPADAQPTGQSQVPPEADAQALATNGAATLGQPASVPAKQRKDDDRYRYGIVIWETGEDAKIPFLLKFNNNTQFRYLNTLSSND